jgi:hypothetical protein
MIVQFHKLSCAVFDLFIAVLDKKKSAQPDDQGCNLRFLDAI